MPVWKRVQAGEYEYKGNKIYYFDEPETLKVGWYVLPVSQDLPLCLGPYSTYKLAKAEFQKELRILDALQNQAAFLEGEGGA